MISVIRSSWALLLGMMMLMMGNGLQGTLLGIRGEIEGFSIFSMSLIMSAYFAGFLGGSRLTPQMIRRVGHVRVFAALASLISAVLILYPAAAHPLVWTLGRILIGFCFSGVYVTAESWLNNAASNENRGKALSLYMIVQMVGIVSAQYLLVAADVSGYVLFVIASITVSLAITPILLSVSPTPSFASTKPMSLVRLFNVSPLGCVGMFFLGGVFSAQFGMSAVFGTLAGLSVGQISLFVSVIYIGALLFQYPIGWVSDRMDRRILILIVALIGGVGSLIGAFAMDVFSLLLVSAFLLGGMSNPLYALLIAYTNDYLEHDDMASASAGLLFINGMGAIAGPVVIGWTMGAIGPRGFFLFVGGLLLVLAAYALWRMTQRPSRGTPADYTSYTPVMATASPVAVEAAQEIYIEADSETEWAKSTQSATKS